MKQRFSWPLLALISAGVADALVRINTGSPAQVVVVLWFLLVCPGMMAVRFLQLDEPLAEWMLAIALSLAIDTFVAGALLMARAWSPPVAFSIIVIIVALTALGAMFDAARKSATVRSSSARLFAGASTLTSRLSKRWRASHEPTRAVRVSRLMRAVVRRVHGSDAARAHPDTPALYDISDTSIVVWMNEDSHSHICASLDGAVTAPDLRRLELRDFTLATRTGE